MAPRSHARSIPTGTGTVARRWANSSRTAGPAPGVGTQRAARAPAEGTGSATSTKAGGVANSRRRHHDSGCALTSCSAANARIVNFDLSYAATSST